MCVCDKKCRHQHLSNQERLLHQIEALSEECRAWREVSGRFPPAHLFRIMKKTDESGWNESLLRGTIGFEDNMNFWQRLKFLFLG